MQKITTNDLRLMKDSEGLIIGGCGGDLQEWVDGINEMLTEAGILQNGARFTDVSVFEHEGITSLLFKMDDVDLNVGKLAMWRLQTHSQFGGTWLSDFVPNKLDGFIAEVEQKTEKPDCELIGQDGNIFNLMGIAARTLKRNGMYEQATEMCEKIRACGSYDEALCTIGEYVNITGPSEIEQDEDGLEMGGIS